MVVITIDDILDFTPNFGVLIRKGAIESSPERVHEAIRVAFSHMNDQPLVDACCGGIGPLAGLGRIDYEEYLRMLEEIRVAQATKMAKRRHSSIRRVEFNRVRSSLVLAMIDADIPYVCATEGCGVHENLTVDHVVPLSRGGTDEIPNLRFMCRRHNSAKSDRNA